MVKRVQASALAFGIAAGLAGCGSDMPVYSETEVCGVSSTVVADVLGTDRFEVTDDMRSTMPFDGDAVRDDVLGFDARTRCLVSAEDASLFLRGDVVDVGDVEVAQSVSKRSDTAFRHEGGIGSADGATGSWACGQVRLLVSVSGDDEPSTTALQAVTKAFSDVAGCWSD